MLLGERVLDKIIDELFLKKIFYCRHKGAKHLKSSAVNLTWYQYMLLDVFGAAFTIILIIFFAIKKIFTFMCRRKSTNDISKKKKSS